MYIYVVLLHRIVTMLAENDFPKMASVHVSIQTSFVRLNALNVSTVQHGNDKLLAK